MCLAMPPTPVLPASEGGGGGAKNIPPCCVQSRSSQWLHSSIVVWFLLISTFITRQIVTVGYGGVQLMNLCVDCCIMCVHCHTCTYIRMSVCLFTTLTSHWKHFI